MASPKLNSSPARPKLVKRACDQCKVRKIKCSEVAPCAGCISAGIECTFKKLQVTRGPKSLRARTIARIAQARGDHQTPVDGSDSGGAKQREHLSKLLELLDIYSTRLYPIWPIFDAEQLAHKLVTEPGDVKALHLAEAVALATIAQLKLSSSFDVAVEKIEKEGQDDNRDMVDSLRVSFFLHIYYENQTAGGTKSLVYLREAITKAHILRLDRESTYASLEAPDQQLFRRILWLLFVTERGVAMLHKLPVVLKPNIMFPWFGRADDRGHVLPAFLKLVHLFWVFDQSGIFELLRNSDSDVSNMESLARGCLELLQKKLRDSATIDDFEANDVQRADLFVTRQWMRAVLWRAALQFGIVVPDNNPVDVAGKFLSQVGQMPKTALESQGPTLEVKTFEIATAVIDAAASNSGPSNLGRSREVLQGLQRILSSSRGGNTTLLSLLNERMAVIAPDFQLLSLPSPDISTNAVASFNSAAMNAFLPEAIDWSSLGDAAELEHVVANEPSYHSIEQQNAQMSWPPLEMGQMIHPSSPMMQVLLDTTVNDPEEAFLR